MPIGIFIFRLYSVYIENLRGKFWRFWIHDKIYPNPDLPPFVLLVDENATEITN
jgi:hypothetical protein